MQFVKDLVGHLDASADKIVDTHGADAAHPDNATHYENDSPQDPTNFSGHVVVNGVEVPRVVYDQLINHGIPLSSFSESQLQDAVRACHHDTKLIDDPNGTGFNDQLHLEDHEKNPNASGDNWVNRVGGKLDKKAQSFCDQLTAEQETDHPHHMTPTPK